MARKVLRLLSIFMVRYFLRAVYNSGIFTLFFLRWKILAIPYVAKVDFCQILPDRPSLSPELCRNVYSISLYKNGDFIAVAQALSLLCVTYNNTVPVLLNAVKTVESDFQFTGPPLKM